jgi:hypothetical protein
MPVATKTTGSQFDAILTKRKQPTSESEVAAKGDSARRSRLAKSKDPNFRAATLYLRKKTLAECEYRLKSTEDSRDMSELVEELMTAWLSGSNA